jgi:sulfite exporter TauE/SafE
MMIRQTLDEMGLAKGVEIDRARDRLIFTGTAWDAAKRERVSESLRPLGYELYEPGEYRKKKGRETAVAAGLAVALAALLWALQTSGILGAFSPQGGELGLAAAFTLGIVASLSSCFALVGGIMLSYVGAVSRRDGRLAIPALIGFHAGRLGFFALGGGILGLAGSLFTLSYQMNVALFGAAGACMLFFGLGMLGVGKLIPRKSKHREKTSTTNRAAASGSVALGPILGALTFFLPCGFTQSVQLQALTAGSFGKAVLLLGCFALGTMPVLFLTGMGLAKGLSGARRRLLSKAAGFFLLILGASQLYGAANLLASAWRG